VVDAAFARGGSLTAAIDAIDAIVVVVVVVSLSAVRSISPSSLDAILSVEYFPRRSLLHGRPLRCHLRGLHFLYFLIFVDRLFFEQISNAVLDGVWRRPSDLRGILRSKNDASAVASASLLQFAIVFISWKIAIEWMTADGGGAPAERHSRDGSTVHRQSRSCAGDSQGVFRAVIEA
jgi:hypothetical protein